MHYQKHIFFCTNQKSNGEGCGNLYDDNAVIISKEQLKAQQLWGEGQVRISKSGCLGRCKEGPICVVYPEGVWYNYVDNEDIQEIVEEHLIHGRPVERLKI